MTEQDHHYRILLVDDSSVVRRVLSDLISSDPLLQVAGTASNGRIALDRITQLKPDLIVLDIEMPEMDGLTTLAEIRKRYRRLPVIMFSTLTQRGASATLDALTLGADDYVSKERNSLGLAAAMDDLRRDMLPKIHALCSRDNSNRMASPTAPARPVLPPLAKLPDHRIDLVVIGVSTGGPDALNKVLPGIPRDLPVPVVIVQHMPPVFTRLLAERLTSKCAMPVKEAVGGEELLPGTIWLAQGGKHLKITASPSGTMLLQTDEKTAPRNYCRPSVDVLFETAAKLAGASTLAVVLTGMGSDGLQGCELIRKQGGQVLVQDEATCVVWGMPGAVARAGLADAILPVSGIIPEVLRRVMKFRKSNAFSNVGKETMRVTYVQQSK